MFDEFFEKLHFGREVVDAKGEHWLSLKHFKDSLHLCVGKYAEDPAPTFLIKIDEEATKAYADKQLEALKKQQAEAEKDES